MLDPAECGDAFADGVRLMDLARYGIRRWWARRRLPESKLNVECKVAIVRIPAERPHRSGGHAGRISRRDEAA